MLLIFIICLDIVLNPSKCNLKEEINKLTEVNWNFYVFSGRPMIIVRSEASQFFSQFILSRQTSGPDKLNEQHAYNLSGYN